MSNRNLRRLAGKKNGGDLVAVIHGLKAAAGGLQAALPEAKRDLEAAQAIAAEFRGGLDHVLYMLDRQRAVFLRLLHNLIVLGDGATEELLSLEAEYGAEYDAMRFLMWVAMLGAGEDP